ncbi:MAG TPA: hypothetical protein P5075_11490 [Eubacteriales bacterium]|nr:hypothetical protein [Eubacteriales bacterium]
MAIQQSAGRPYPQGGTRSTGTRRRKKKKNNTLLLSILALVLIGAALLIYQFIFNKQESTVSMELTPISTSSTYINTGDGLLYQTDGQIHFYHLTDSKKNYTYGMSASDNIRMSGSESMTVVFNEAQLQVVGEKTPLTFTGTIQEVECGDEHLAVLLQDAEDSESVLIITRDGEQIADLPFEDQYIVDFGFYTAKNEMLWIETLNVNTGTPMTTISTYDFVKQEITGLMHVQSQLVDQIYITSDSMFVVATNQIIRYTHEGNKEVYRVTIYGYQAVDFSDASDSPTFLLTTRGGDFHTVKILTLEEASEADSVETTLQLPTEGVAAFIMNGKLVVVSRENVYTYTLKGKLSSTASFEQAVDEAFKLTDTKLLLSSNGMYYIANAG